LPYDGGKNPKINRDFRLVKFILELFLRLHEVGELDPNAAHAFALGAMVAGEDRAALFFLFIFSSLLFSSPRFGFRSLTSTARIPSAACISRRLYPTHALADEVRRAV